MCKAVSHMALNGVEPLMGLSRREGWILILMHVHNWLGTHDASSIDVYSRTVIIGIAT
jgi:hypothetical protein